MKLLKTWFLFLFVIVIISSCTQKEENKTTFTSGELIIRLSEIQIDPNYRDEYIAILKEESEASVRLEQGVISIYPMVQKENPTEIRILEIYANKDAYESHLQTKHFKQYKESTLEMVKSLRLVDMIAIDEETMPQIFKKFTDKK
jgi:quinol monooxygenase YgiN